MKINNYRRVKSLTGVQPTCTTKENRRGINIKKNTVKVKRSLATREISKKKITPNPTLIHVSTCMVGGRLAYGKTDPSTVIRNEICKTEVADSVNCSDKLKTSLPRYWINGRKPEYVTKNAKGRTGGFSRDKTARMSLRENYQHVVLSDRIWPPTRGPRSPGPNT